MTEVNNTSEAVSVILEQLQDKSYYLHNYALLESVSDYLDKCLDKNDDDFDKFERIFNHLEYDLKWTEELFPMEL